MSEHCDCGESDQDVELVTCRHPGCTVVGCDSCGEVDWCCDYHDDANGEFFCRKHSIPEPTETEE